MSIVSLGQISYEAYCKHTDWKSLVSGAQLPAWTDLKPEIQSAWEVSAQAVVDSHVGSALA